MKVIIAGGREFTDPALIERAVELSGWRDEITAVISGRANGIDTLGEHWAIGNGVPIIARPADWKRYGLKAGPLRNALMAADAAPDGGLILIWSGFSRGSANMKMEAAKKGLRKFELLVNEQYPEGMPI